MKQINLRVDENLLDRIDRARVDVPRERWIRRAVEQALERLEWKATAEALSDPLSRETLLDPTGDYVEVERPEAQLGHVPGPNVENIRSSAQAKRDVRAIPKKGKP